MAGATPTDDEIMAALQASGYLMEQEVGTLLESLGFQVQTNRAYKDPEENKSRELDVRAFKSIAYNEAARLYLNIELLCECKNNTTPFVFLGRSKNPADRYPAPEEYRFPTQEYMVPSPDNPQAVMMMPAFRHLNLSPIHYYYGQDTKAVQFCKIVRQGSGWEAQHGGIYDAMFYPLVKALLARRAEVKPRSNPSRDHVIWLFFPVVVLQGDIYYVDSQAAPPVPEKRSHVTFVRQLQSEMISGTFAVDFVTQTSLAEFVTTTIAPFVNQLAQWVRDAPTTFTSPHLPSLA